MGRDRVFAPCMQRTIVKALYLHFFHKVPCGIAVIVYPRREQVVFADSTRRIVLPQYIVGLLKRHRALQTEQRFRMGGQWKNADLVFTNKSGGFYLATNMNNKLKRIIAGTDLPQDLHLHSMRHTHASLLINSGLMMYNDVRKRVMTNAIFDEFTCVKFTMPA